MISSSFWFTLFETLLYIHYYIRVILVRLWLHIHTSNCKITTCYTPIQASSLYSHIYTHIHILYTKSHIQSRYQDFQQTNFPFPLSTIMDRLPATHIIYLSIYIDFSRDSTKIAQFKPTPKQLVKHKVNQLTFHIYISRCSILCPHYEYRITILIGV